MQNIPWSNPVRLSVGSAGGVTIEGPLEALDYLLTVWPTTDGDHFEAGKRACMEAMEGVIPPDQAREAFIAAAIDAKFPVS